MRYAVPPNLVSFVESASGVPVSAYGVDSQQQLDDDSFRNFWSVRDPVRALRQLRAYHTQGWTEMSETLTALAADADAIVMGTTYQEIPANVAEARGIPLIALHMFPLRANHSILPVRLPRPMVRALWAGLEGLFWRVVRPADDQQRRRLGLPGARVRSPRRITGLGTLEIQAYDEVLFPDLDRQWRGRRPLVGTLTLQRATDHDAEVAAWIAAGTPPVSFGFGSMPVTSPTEAVATIEVVCADLNVRALICSGVWSLEPRADTPEVKVVPSVHHETVFPRCRAIVHHGGSGTTAAGARSGVPAVVVWVGADQPIWAGRVEKLGIGSALRFSSMTKGSLRRALEVALEPATVTRARALAGRMTTPAAALNRAADLVESALPPKLTGPGPGS